MRIRSTALQQIDGTILWRSKPYTGVVYDAQDSGEIPEIHNVIAGKNVGPHVDWSHGQRRVDEETTEWSMEEERLLFGGKAFDGVVYRFDESGILDRETGDAATKHWYPISEIFRICER